MNTFAGEVSNNVASSPSSNQPTPTPMGTGTTNTPTSQPLLNMNTHASTAPVFMSSRGHDVQVNVNGTGVNATYANPIHLNQGNATVMGGISTPADPHVSGASSGGGAGQSSATSTSAGLMEKQHVDEQRELTQLLALMDDYVPTIPDAVTNYYLRSAGFDCPDEKVVRIVSMAAQKFIGELAAEALQKQKINQLSANNKAKKAQEKKHVLTMDDLSYVLAHQGIVVKKPMYFT
eukprot:CFRG6209T1